LRSEKVTGSFLTGSFFCFRRLLPSRFAKSHADTTRRRKEDRDKECQLSRDKNEGHSRLEHRTIATAGQGFMILVCGTAL
jgi:ribosomal protein L32